AARLPRRLKVGRRLMLFGTAPVFCQRWFAEQGCFTYARCRSILEDGHQGAPRFRECDVFEQTHSTVFVNNSFNGSDHCYILFWRPPWSTCPLIEGSRFQVPGFSLLSGGSTGA